MDPRLSQEYLGGALCLSPAVQGESRLSLCVLREQSAKPVLLSKGHFVVANQPEDDIAVLTLFLAKPPCVQFHFCKVLWCSGLPALVDVPPCAV